MYEGIDTVTRPGHAYTEFDTDMAEGEDDAQAAAGVTDIYALGTPEPGEYPVSYGQSEELELEVRQAKRVRFS